LLFCEIGTPAPLSDSVTRPASPKRTTFQVVQHVISEATGNDPEDITLDAALADDLGIEMLTDFLPIVKGIQKHIDVILPTQEVKRCLTVAELVELVDEEREL
jgi:acyl carrier protein